MLKAIYFFFGVLFFMILPASHSIDYRVAFPTTRYDTVWVFDHYKANPEYIVGIWPNSLRTLSADKISELKSRFGFEYIALEIPTDLNRFNLIKSSGFPPDRIMVTFQPANLEQKTREFGKIYAYYLDEPNERGFSIDGLREIINKNAEGSEFIISGYRRTSNLIGMVSESDGVMFSSYVHWWQCFPNVWCAWPYDDDQRDDWTDMKERYGEKSFMNWIGAHRDTLEYNDLLKHAADLSLKGIWFYQQLDEKNSDKNILDFCFAAWKNSFMKRYERKYIYEYTCISSDCSSFNKNDSGTWVLTNIRTTEEIRIVSPKGKFP